MSIQEKLNSLFRLSIYIGVLLTIIYRHANYLYIPLIVGAFTWIVYKTRMEEKSEEFVGGGAGAACVKPTPDNPYMNFRHAVDDPNRPPACKDEVSQEQATQKYRDGMFMDFDILYSKMGTERIHTMPVTSSMNDQNAFAKWCYATGPTCKERTDRCTSENML